MTVHTSPGKSQSLSLPTARRLVEQYWVWPVITNTVHDITRASEIQERYQLSFWDALIIYAAVNGDADTILTEDLFHDQNPDLDFGF